VSWLQFTLKTGRSASYITMPLSTPVCDVQFCSSFRIIFCVPLYCCHTPAICNVSPAFWPHHWTASSVSQIMSRYLCFPTPVWSEICIMVLASHVLPCYCTTASVLDTEMMACLLCLCPSSWLRIGGCWHGHQGSPRASVSVLASVACWTHSATCIPVHCLISSVQHLRGLPRRFFPTMMPCKRICRDYQLEPHGQSTVVF